MINGRGVNTSNNDLELGDIPKQSKNRHERPSTRKGRRAAERETQRAAEQTVAPMQEVAIDITNSVETPEARDARLGAIAKARFDKEEQQKLELEPIPQAQITVEKHNGADEKRIQPAQPIESAHAMDAKEENLIKLLPWIKGDTRFQREMMELLKNADNKWLLDILIEAKLPPKIEETPIGRTTFYKKLKKALTSNWAAAIFSASCAGSLWLFYLSGGASAGLMFQIGGIIVNTVQNLLYGVESYFFFLNPGSAFNFGIGVTGGLIASGANAAAAATVSNNDLATILCTGVGSAPLQIYGMASVIKGLREEKDPVLRAQFVNKWQTAFATFENIATHGNLLQTPNNSYGRTLASMALGVGVLGVTQAFGSAGYAWSAYIAGKNLLNHTFGIIFTLFAMGPQTAVALLISGYQLGKSIIDMTADTIQFCRNKREDAYGEPLDTINYRITAYKAKVSGVQLLLNANMFFWGMFYSYASAAKQAELATPANPETGDKGNPDGMPEMPQPLEILKKFSVTVGTGIFNTVMSMKAVNAVCRLVSVAYESNQVQRGLYHLEYAAELLATGPVSKLREVGTRHNFFPSAPQLSIQVAPRQHDGYDALGDGNDNSPSPR